MNPNPTNENKVELYVALVNAVSETKDIVADATNPFHKNKYATLSAHLSALKPIFAKHGLAIIQFPIGSAESVGVRTTIIHTSGQSLSADALVPAEKGMSGQNAGALVSYLRRYAIAGVCGVATDDDDAESDRVAKTQYKSAPVASQTVSLGTTKTSKFIPNPNAEQAVQSKGSSSAVAPFGDAKGQPLSALPRTSDDRSKKCADLNYWANVWEPRPFGDSGKVSAKDSATKSEAIRLWNEAEAPASSDPTMDDVPF